jgi:DNA-binding NarL/FixJ family response regulator
VLSAVRLLREGVVASLSHQPTVQVVGASDLSMPALEIAAFQPDAILLDICVPGGLDAAIPIRRAMPDAKVVAFGVAEHAPVVMACARAGIAGFVYPHGSAHDIVMAVHSAVRGELVCSPRTAGILLNQAGAAAPAGAEESLTPREREILALLGEGLSNKQIARALRIGNATVKNHVHSILGKLGVARRGEAAAQLHRRADGNGAAMVPDEPHRRDQSAHTA